MVLHSPLQVVMLIENCIHLACLFIDLHSLFIDLYSVLCFDLHVVLTCMRKESANEWYCNSEKDEKPPTTWLDDTAILHIKISITEVLHEKETQYSYNTVNPNVPLL